MPARTKTTPRKPSTARGRGLAALPENRRPSSRASVLYSVGWNEQDDAGRNDLDWVWNYPK
jgi:hypothetical protein